MAYHFVRNRKNTRFLSRGKAHDAIRVITRDEGVRAVKLLKVVHVNFVHMNDYNLVFAQLGCKHITLEIQFSEWPMSNIVPKNKSRWWKTWVFSRTDEWDYISAVEHCRKFDSSLEVPVESALELICVENSYTLWCWNNEAATILVEAYGINCFSWFGVHLLMCIK